ncbi:hypothetical protein Tco_0772995 [Tanacetum coccineum]|uniref:Uncharacterized protein n=1 Tax=Tanacetum coccineum TaxID=301880 RepID=A0ABQ4ZJL3_9ASTR
MSTRLSGIKDLLREKHQRAAKDSLSAKISECKASASNLRRIQVKDIIKEVKDYLKTYSSAGMDISWLFELKPVPCTKLVKVVNSWQNCSLTYGSDVSKNGRALDTSYDHHKILDRSQVPPLRIQPRSSIDRECCKE